MKKALVILAILASAFSSLAAGADTVKTNNAVTEGRIQHIVGGLVEVHTTYGVRSLDIASPPELARDIVEIGFIRRKKVSGYINYLDDGFAEVITADGTLKIKRYKIRNIILSRESISNL